MTVSTSHQTVAWDSHSSHVGEMVRLICCFHLRNLLATSLLSFPLLALISSGGVPAEPARERSLYTLLPIRRDIVPRPRNRKDFCLDTRQRMGREPKYPHYSWAKMLPKVFKIDVTKCASCGGDLVNVAPITDPMEARRFLRPVGLPYSASA